MSTCCEDVHVGDIGTHYQARIQDCGGVPFDPSLASVKRFLFRTPTGLLERPATVTTDGTDWFLNYHLQAGTDDAFHARPGTYQWQGFLQFDDGQTYHTNIEKYAVVSNLD
jgi:hypothetical protein